MLYDGVCRVHSIRCHEEERLLLKGLGHRQAGHEVPQARCTVLVTAGIPALHVQDQGPGGLNSPLQPARQKGPSGRVTMP